MLGRSLADRASSLLLSGRFPDDSGLICFTYPLFLTALPCPGFPDDSGLICFTYPLFLTALPCPATSLMATLGNGCAPASTTPAPTTSTYNSSSSSSSSRGSLSHYGGSAKTPGAGDKAPQVCFHRPWWGGAGERFCMMKVDYILHSEKVHPVRWSIRSTPLPRTCEACPGAPLVGWPLGTYDRTDLSIIRPRSPDSHRP
jgi:hypothetical protein